MICQSSFDEVKALREMAAPSVSRADVLARLGIRSDSTLRKYESGSQTRVAGTLPSEVYERLINLFGEPLPGRRGEREVAALLDGATTAIRDAFLSGTAVIWWKLVEDAVVRTGVRRSDRDSTLESWCTDGEPRRASGGVLRFATVRNERVGLDPGPTVPVEACFQAPESGCAAIQWHPQRRSFSSHFQDAGMSQSSVESLIHQADRDRFEISHRPRFNRSRARDQANYIGLASLQLPFF
jgi:hypothetical protein